MNDDLLTVYLMGVQDGKNQMKEIIKKIEEVLKDPDRDGFDEDGYDDSFYDMVYIDRIEEIIKEFEENKYDK